MRPSGAITTMRAARRARLVEQLLGERLQLGIERQHGAPAVLERRLVVIADALDRDRDRSARRADRVPGAGGTAALRVERSRTSRPRGGLGGGAPATATDLVIGRRASGRLDRRGRRVVATDQRSPTGDHDGAGEQT